MHAWYVNRRSTPILDAKVMVLFAAALVLILVWLLPRDQTFRAMLAKGDADRVSISYARLLVSIDPDDAELRRLLAGQYYEIGELHNAWNVLKEDDGGRSVLGVKVLQKITYSYVEGPQRDLWRARLEANLEAIVAGESVPAGDLAELARFAQGLNRSGMAALLRERIFEVTDSDIDLIKTSRAWLAADNATRALTLLKKTGVRDNPLLLTVMVEVALAAGVPAAALPLIDDYLITAMPTSEQLVGFVTVARSAGDSARVVSWLKLVSNPTDLTFEQAMTFADAAVGTAQLKLGIVFMQHALDVRDPSQAQDQALPSRIAQAYEWSGQPDAAMRMWLQVADQGHSLDVLDRAWRLGQNLYQYTNVSLLLTRISDARRLTDEEVVALRTSYEQRGTPQLGNDALQNYLRRVPQHRQAWIELVALQTNNLALADVDRSWRKFALHHLLTPADYQAWARILWRQYRTEDALALLLSVEGATDAEHWRQVSAYAWFLDDLEVGADALERLLVAQGQQGRSLGTGAFAKLIRAAAQTDPERALEHALTAYEAYPKQSNFLLQALQLAVDLGDDELAEELFAEALEPDGSVPPLTLNASFWALNARYLQSRGDLAGARVSMQTALAIDPLDAHLRASHLWLLLAAEDFPELHDAVVEYSPNAANEAILWPALASAWAIQGEHSTAAYWFDRAVSRDNYDIGMLLAYSGSLEALGRVDATYRLRRFALHQLLERAKTSGELNADTLISASRSLLSGPTQKVLLVRLLAQAPLAASIRSKRKGIEQQALPRFELADALRREHYSAARYWLRRGAQSTAYDALSIAVDSHDGETLNTLLAHADPRVRQQAALALGNYPEAFAVASQSADVSQSPRANRSANGSLGGSSTWSLGAPTNSWQLRPGWNRLGNVTTQSNELRVQARIYDRQYEAELRTQTVSIDGILNTTRFTETQLKGRAFFDNYVGTGSVSVNLVAGGLRSLVGGMLEQNLRVDRRNSFRLAASVREASSSSDIGGGLAQVLLDRSGVEFDWLAEPERRHSFSTRVNWFRHRDPEDNVVGSSAALTLTHRLALLRSAASADLRTSLSATRSSQKVLSTGLAELVNGASGGLLPADSQLLSVGAIVWRDDPGERAWQRTGLRYRFEFDVGYQVPERQFTYSTQLSAGIALFGKDELSVRAGFSNSLQNQGSERGVRAQLAYSRYLD